MKKQIMVFLLGVVFIPTCVGCGAESINTEQIETAIETTTEKVTREQPEETTVMLEKATEQEPETTTEPSEETIVEIETETAEPDQTKETIPESQAEYTYIDMSATMYAQQTVNVRDLPDTNGNKVGSLSTNDKITITGQCNETNWYRFEYNGSVAYVSDKYVGESIVEMQQQASTDNAGSSSVASNSCPYTLWQPVDDGVRISWYVTQPDPGWETNGHRQIQKGIYDTLSDRNRDNIPPGYFGYSEQIEWIYMGTYAEGNVYKQTFEYRVYPKDSFTNF